MKLGKYVRRELCFASIELELSIMNRMSARLSSVRPDIGLEHWQGASSPGATTGRVVHAPSASIPMTSHPQLRMTPSLPAGPQGPLLRVPAL
jgi:hypothetical protein